MQLLSRVLCRLELVLRELHIGHVLLWVLHLILLLLELVLHHMLVLVVAQVMVVHSHVIVPHLWLLLASTSSHVGLHIHENLSSIRA